MLDKARTLNGFTLSCRDGPIGFVREFYFDDRQWTIRYLVPSTDHGLTGRQVLLSPYALHSINRDAKDIAVALTKRQLADSPGLDTYTGMSRQFEEPYYGYLWPQHGGGPYTWDCYPGIVRDLDQWRDTRPEEQAWNRHLHSTKDVSGYHVQATDGEIGHVDDFIIDDETWAIRYLVIDTGQWRSGKKVLVAPQWADRVSWTDAVVYMALSRAAIQASPEYTDECTLTRDYETDLHGHYHRPGYWVDEPATAASA